MDQEPISNLPDLPPSNSAFWDNANKSVAQYEHKKCEHYFKRDTQTITCIKCGIGYLDYSHSIKIENGTIM